MIAEQTTTPCIHCHDRDAQIMAILGGDQAGYAPLCADCAIEDKATRLAIGMPLPIYARFVQPAQQRLFDDAELAMRRWAAADRAVAATFMGTDTLIRLLNTPPWPGHAAAA
jgi:hypothetical protein